MRFVRVGADALLVEVDDAAGAVGLYVEARRRALPALDIVPAARSVLFDGVADPAGLETRLSALTPDASAADEGRLVEVPTTYDGADLDTVARLWGMTRAEAVATHTGTDFVVAFCGFAPGFAYCTGLPAALHVPRLDTPRSRVPAGSVGVAGEFTGVYPTASPGGWRLLGRTDLTLWDPGRPEPALLAPGTRVRFTAVAP